MLKLHRAPPCRFEFYHVVQLLPQGDTKKIRRRLKEIVDISQVVNEAVRNQFWSVSLERPQPFRSASTDCGLTTLRCNNDFRFLPKGFPDGTALEEAFRCTVDQLAACFRFMKAHIKMYGAVRRMAMTVVAVHVVANVIDYYITKYAAKPMEQLQNLVTQYALGLRRLELEEEEAAAAVEADVTGVAQADKDRARGLRRLLRLQYSANRCKWMSSTENALYLHTEQQHVASHHEVTLFITRPMHLLSQ